MKARELEEGMTVRSGKRVGVVTSIKTRIMYHVQPPSGPPVGYFVDGDHEVEVVEL